MERRGGEEAAEGLELEASEPSVFYGPARGFGNAIGDHLDCFLRGNVAIGGHCEAPQSV